jgi:hypothetical protein
MRGKVGSGGAAIMLDIRGKQKRPRRLEVASKRKPAVNDRLLPKQQMAYIRAFHSIRDRSQAYDFRTPAKPPPANCAN